MKLYNKHTKGIRKQTNKATKICTITDITSIDFSLINNHQVENYDNYQLRAWRREVLVKEFVVLFKICITVVYVEIH